MPLENLERAERERIILFSILFSEFSPSMVGIRSIRQQRRILGTAEQLRDLSSARQMTTGLIRERAVAALCARIITKQETETPSSGTTSFQCTSGNPKSLKVRQQNLVRTWPSPLRQKAQEIREEVVVRGNRCKSSKWIAGRDYARLKHSLRKIARIQSNNEVRVPFLGTSADKKGSFPDPVKPSQFV